MRRRVVALSSLGAVAAVAFAQSLQPLNVKTGLWQIAETITWTGLPPQMAAAMGSGRAHNYQSCVTPKDLSSNPWSQGAKASCMWNVLSSTGTDMEIQGTSCDMGGASGLMAQVHGKIHILDSQDGVGSFDLMMSGNGQTMNGHVAYVGKWVGSSCPTQ
jgi:hypothetical protein